MKRRKAGPLDFLLKGVQDAITKEDKYELIIWISLGILIIYFVCRRLWRAR